MRYLLPVVAAATALTIGLAPAAAQSSSHHRHRPERVESHVSLHLSGHTVLAGNGVAVRGRVRPSGRHRVKVVFHGPGGGVVRTATTADGRFAVRWSPRGIGDYAVRAFGVHDRRTRGSAGPTPPLPAHHA